MKIGLFFGSFNPIHIGHLIIGEYISNYYVDKVWFVISPQNPLKSEFELLDIDNRISLVKAAIADNEKFEFSDAELYLPLPSYTVNSLKYFKKKFPEHDFFLIMGSDNFLNLSKWKSPEVLLKNYNFLVYERPKFEVSTQQHFASNITLLEAPLISISSTQIRELISAGKSVRYLLPDAVLKIINRNQFYYK